MIRLQAFGGAVLFGDDGARLLGAASQRRILGLLSVLAAAGERGLTREKIVGILWPDSAPRRARHSLTQTLYAARRALECDDLFEAGEDVRLNPERISSDVGDFEAAFRSGDDATAVALYEGSFLDGFYLSSPGFDWWLHRQRTRLEQEAVVALQRLASAAEDAGEWESAAGRLRRLAAIRPSDSTVAIRLMQALVAAGDRPGAIQHAVVYERLIRGQYELEPDARVLSLASDLRDGLWPGELGAGSPGEGGEGEAESPGSAGGGPEAVTWPASSPGADAESPGTVPDAPAGAGLGERRGLRRGPGRFGAGRIWWLSAAVVVLLFGSGIMLWRLRRTPREALYRALDQRVVVAPFRVVGADHGLAYLREGVVDMLSTRLADDTAARSVDPGAVLAAWRQAGITRASEVSRDSVVRLATRLGAERVVVGNIVGTSGRMIMNAAVLLVPSGRVAGEATVEGTAGRLNELINQLAAKLLLVQAGESERLAERMTHSLPALRAYLAGVTADARGEPAVAARSYARALQLDSTFALSALHLAVAAARLNDFEVERRALYRAWHSRAGLSERDRAELSALLGPRYPAPSTAGQALAAWQAAVRLAPNREEVWLGLAKRILTDGAVAGLGHVRDRTFSALQRAIALDPDDAAAQLLLARIGGGKELHALRQEADSGTLPPHLFFRWSSAVERADAPGLARLADSLPSAGPGNLREIAAAAAFESLRPEDGARALEALARRAGDGDQALGLLLARHSLALERGRPARALDITREIGRLGPTGRPHLRLQVLDAVFGEGDAAAAALAAQELRRTAMNVDLPNASADACALAQWQLARSDTIGTRITLALLQGAPAEAPPAAVGAPAPFCAALVGAELAVATGRADARAEVKSLDALVLTSIAAGDVAAYAPIVISRLYRRLGDPVEALAAIRRRPFLEAVWPRYLATELKEEADLARETGELAGAARACREYLSLRSEPEPALEPRVREVRALAETLPTR